MTNLTPRQIVEELDRHIIGQEQAKKAVAIALRNRWRRSQIASPLKEEIVPKNILMVGPTGVGKTEIARRLARLTDSPFIKVEATKYTEVGYVGRDVEQIIRDLTEIAIQHTKEKWRKNVQEKAKEEVTKRLLDVLVGENASEETRHKFGLMLEKGELEEKEIDIYLSEQSSLNMPTLDIPGMPGAQMGMINLGDILGKSFGAGAKTLKKMTVSQARKQLLVEESDRLSDQDKIVKDAIATVESHGIVFIDEIDKVSGKGEKRGGPDVSREGVQRDLLPLIEGTTVTTKHGPVRTDHILFITSGAFHLSKPSDLLPELQGRLPIRVELSSLTQEDFVKILTQTEHNLIKQTKALLAVEGVSITFEDGAIDKLAFYAQEMNQRIENIGARRLHTLIEKITEDIHYEASEGDIKDITICPNDVSSKMDPLLKDQALGKFIL